LAKAVLKSVFDKFDSKFKASNRLLLPDAFVPAITVSGENSISKSEKDLKPFISIFVIIF
jgi:hypothetical protein